MDLQEPPHSAYGRKWKDIQRLNPALRLVCNGPPSPHQPLLNYPIREASHTPSHSSMHLPSEHCSRHFSVPLQHVLSVLSPPALRCLSRSFIALAALVLVSDSGWLQKMLSQITLPVLHVLYFPGASLWPE